MLEIMMLWCMAFQQNHSVGLTQTAVGQYVEVVNSQYNTKTNQTYVVIARYGIDVEGQTPYLMFLQPRPFVGQPTKETVLKSIEVVSYVKVVGLN